MNSLEIVFLITFIVSGLRFFIPQLMQSPRAAVLSLPSLLMLLVLLVSGSLRWTMLALYGLAALLIVNDAVFFIRKKSAGGRLFSVLGITLRLLVIFLMAGSIILSAFFPVRPIAKPHLAQKVGSLSMALTDTKRQEVFGEQKGFREVMVQFWYPAENVKGCRRKPWITTGREVGEEIARDMGFPGFILSHVGMIPAHAWLDAPLAKRKKAYPVVIISHGWKGFRDIHEDIAELLASHGFIVAALDHTYGSYAVEFPDGRVARVDQKAMPPGKDRPAHLADGRELIRVYGGDIRFLADRIEDLNSGVLPSRFEGQLDLSRMGVLGHSTGGGAAVLAAQEDPRLDAVAAMDPWVEPLTPAVLSEGLSQSLFVLSSGEWAGNANEDNLYLTLGAARSAARAYRIDGTTHIDFTAARHLTRLGNRLGMLGSLPGSRSSRIIRHSLLLFFQEELVLGVGGVVENLDVFYPEFKQIYPRREKVNL